MIVRAACVGAFLCSVALGAAGCVDTVRFSAQSPSLAAAQRALAAEHALVHPQTRAMVDLSPVFKDRVSVCLANGQALDVSATRLSDAEFCGVALSPGATERCWSYRDLQAIGVPRDSTTFGYYPVRGYLNCDKT